MQNSERMNAQASCAAALVAGVGASERCEAKGRYVVECFDRDGALKWRDEALNVVTTLGKNLALDSFLAGAAYTVTGPFVGLIAATSYTGVAAADTMAAHAGWLEAGNANAPTYSGNRKTASWAAAAAGAKALAAPASFAITFAGTIKGCFMAYGTGALASVDDTGGTLLSAGLFTGGDRIVALGDTLNVAYSLAL